MTDKTLISVEDAPTVYFDFARRYHGGQFTALYRISCGTMYVSDLPHVLSEIEAAEHHDDGEDTAWSLVLIMARDEIHTLIAEVNQ